MLPITKMPIKYNYSSLANRTINYIVVHDTGNTGAGSGVDGHFAFFNGGDRQSSADFFVDDHKIGQFNPDLRNYYTWHCGDGHGAYGITNSNSIGVEICINSDGNYAQAVQNAVELVQYLMKTYGIDLNHVVRHYDASRKNCPSSMSANNWAAWTSFKSKLAASSGLQIGSNGSDVADLQTKLNYLGYNCGTPDGVFGNGTNNAVVDFQKAKGLAADGVVGAATLSAINNTVSEKKKAEEVKKVKYLVVYNNYVDKRAAERLAEYLQCPVMDAAQVVNFDYSCVQNVIGVGGGTFNAAAKTVIKGDDRDDTTIAVLKYIGKIK